MADKAGGNWFDDDPEWAELRQRTEGQSIQKPKKPPKLKLRRKTSAEPAKIAQKQTSKDPKDNEPKKVNVSLDLTIPKIKLPKLPPYVRLPKRSDIANLSKKQRIVGAAVTVILLIGLIAVPIITKKDTKTITPATSDKTTKPSFKTVSPQGKDIGSLGGFARVSPPGNEPVYAFIDSIDGVTIKVSQQKLPKQLQTNTDEEVKKLAEGFNAIEVINESNPKAYVGMDITGAQSVVFHKNGLLVLINSQKKIDNDRWAEYITKLL
jgi:hypothetical protein